MDSSWFQTNVTEEKRLAVTVHQIDEEVSVVPRSAFLRSPHGLIYKNRSFGGKCILLYRISYLCKCLILVFTDPQPRNRPCFIYCLTASSLSSVWIPFQCELFHRSLLLRSREAWQFSSLHWIQESKEEIHHANGWFEPSYWLSGCTECWHS